VAMGIRDVDNERRINEYVDAVELRSTRNMVGEARLWWTQCFAVGRLCRDAAKTCIFLLSFFFWRPGKKGPQSIPV